MCERWCVTKWCGTGAEAEAEAPRCVPTFPRPEHPKIQFPVVLDRHLHRLLLLSPSLFRQHSRIKHPSIVPSHSHHMTPLHHPLFTDSALSSHTSLPDDSRLRRQANPTWAHNMLTYFNSKSFLFFQFTQKKLSARRRGRGVVAERRIPGAGAARNRCGSVSGAWVSSGVRGGAAGCGT